MTSFLFTHLLMDIWVASMRYVKFYPAQLGVHEGEEHINN